MQTVYIYKYNNNEFNTWTHMVWSFVQEKIISYMDIY